MPPQYNTPEGLFFYKDGNHLRIFLKIDHDPNNSEAAIKSTLCDLLSGVQVGDVMAKAENGVVKSVCWAEAPNSFSNRASLWTAGAVAI